MSVSPSDALFVRELVHRRSAILLDDAKGYLIEMRLAQLAREQGLASVEELIGKARKGEHNVDVKIVEAIATHETSFYRDIQPFQTLEQLLLPALGKARAASRRLTIWCAACSSGQEPYSIAMLLLEKFPELAAWPTRIVATDLSAQVLAKAHEGKFSQMEMNRGLPAPLMVKYFERHGMQWQVKAAVRNLIEFKQLNLIENWHVAPRPDIVFLRNVLIYFDLPTKKAILERVRECIAPDGALFLGAAETTLNVTDAWERVTSDKHIYYKVRP